MSGLSWLLWARGALVLLTALAATGCVKVEYVLQAGCGQLDLGLRARPIDEAITDPRTSDHARALLQRVGTIKQFAEQNGLTPTRNYEAYAEIDRSAVVYVVNAAEPLSLRPYRWTFPIVGAVPYLGYFRKSDARELADSLKQEGLDVDVHGVEAYSTLGWFHDPVLSNMLAGKEDALGGLANTILHESLHATLYVKGQSPFNESLANFVGEELARRYLDRALGPASHEKTAFVNAQIASARRRKLMQAAHDELAKLYASTASDPDKLREKARILKALRDKTGFRRPINNASLSEFALYNSARAELTNLLASCGGDFPRFLKTLATVNEASFVEHQQRDVVRLIQPFVARGCTG